MAGQRSIYRIARTLLLALAALLAVGAVGSMFLGSRAISQAKVSAVDQARTIVENSLPLTLSPGDVGSPATDTKADLITAKITPVILDPSAWDDVAIWSLDGQIVYSTDRSLIGQRPEEARTSVRDATERGITSSEQNDGMFSVLIPLRFRTDGPVNAAIQMARPDDLIAAAGRPWRYNAILMTIGLIITLLVLYRVMRLTASATANLSFTPSTRDRVAPIPIGTGQRSTRSTRARAPRRGRRAEEGGGARRRGRGAPDRDPGSVPQDPRGTARHTARPPGAPRHERGRSGDRGTPAEGRGQRDVAREPVEGDEHGTRQARSTHRRAGQVQGRRQG